ncbi:MAG: hypothetical protein Q9165_006376 [Trypethelium subeluteriae]
MLSISLLTLLASHAAAQTTTTSIFFGGIADNSDPDNTFFSTVVASVVSADPTATVLAVNCASPPSDNDNDNSNNDGGDSDGDACGGPDVTITANPSLFVLQSTIYASSDTPSATGALTMSTRCELSGTAAATCTWYEGGDAAAFGDDSSDLMSAPYTQVLNATDISFTPITITAGMEKLVAASSSSSDSSTSSGSGSASSTAAPGSTGASSSGASATKGSGSSVTATASKSGSATAASQTGNSATTVGVSSGLLASVAALFAFLA